MLRLERRYFDEMVAHARDAAPNECCGIIAGRAGRLERLFRAVNSAASPYRYNIDTQDLLRIHDECQDRGWDFMVIYHSHVTSEAYPSPTDVRQAAWPDAVHVIVSLAGEDPEARAFRLREAEIEEVELEVTR